MPVDLIESLRDDLTLEGCGARHGGRYLVVLAAEPFDFGGDRQRALCAYAAVCEADVSAGDRPARRRGAMTRNWRDPRGNEEP